jgi:hypothetical protein
MVIHENFAVALGRAVETMRTQPDNVPGQKGQLRTLVALTTLDGACQVG